MLLTNDQRKTMERLRNRAKGIKLFGERKDGTPWSEYCASEIDATLAFDKTGDVDKLEGSDLPKNKAFGKLVERAHGGNEEARMELMSLRIESTQNYLMPALHFGMFFQIIELADNESPAIQNNTKQAFGARYIREDGNGVESTKIIPVQKETHVDLHVLTTDEVTYRLRDLYTGNIAQAAQNTIDLGFDMTNKVDALQLTLLEAGFGNFVLTGNKAARTYNANLRIRDGVLPTANELTTTDFDDDYDTDSLFGIPTLQVIHDYASRWAGVDPSGDIVPTGEIIVPSDEINGIGKAIEFLGAKSSELAENLSRQGYMNIGSFLGVDWKIISNSVIAQKKAIARFNKAAGFMWLKRSWDTDEDTVDKKKNIGTRYQQKAIGLAQTEVQRRHIVRVAYRT